MQILIISGFLGAGKTSFIKAMSKAVGRQFCIVENEFGEMGVDGPLLGSLDDLNIFELTEGCICCNPNIDFASSVLTIANTINPDYLIVEPSGVAMLDRILEQLSSICYEQIKLLAPITLIDGEHFYDQAKEFKEYFQSQVENAASLAFSKSEKFSADDFKKATKFVKENASVQEDAEIYDQHYSLWDKEKWESLFTKFIEWEPKSEKKQQFGTELGAKQLRKSFRFVKKAKEREEAMQSIGLNELAFLNVDEMVTAMNVLVSGLLGRVVRAKGYANIKGKRFALILWTGYIVLLLVSFCLTSEG